MKNRRIPAFLTSLLLAGVCAAATLKPTPSPEKVTASSLKKEKAQLQIERLQLENEKLKFEMEKMKTKEAQATPTPSQKGQTEKDIQVFQAEVSKKAKELADKNKTVEDLVILDLVNSEIWSKGVRFNIHELYTLAEDRRLKMDKSLDERDAAGDPRYLYKINNLSLKRYEGRERGIFEAEAPSKTGDLKILTLEGVSFDSDSGDVRNAFQNLYFAYDGQKKEGKYKVLKYKHNVSWNFADRMEVFFDQQDKLVKLRYGILDEH